MNINSSSYYSVSASSNGLSGIVSGMDTDSMVEKMLSGTQAKIDKQKALKQQTEWKQEIYQDVISSINSFYSKYFDKSYDSSLSTNLCNSAFFDSMISKVKSGSAVNIIGTNSSASIGDVSVAVKQLASSSVLEGDSKMSTTKKIVGTVLTDADLDSVFGSGGSISFDLSLDGVSKTITLSDVKDGSGNITLDSVKDALAEQIQKSFGSYLKVEIGGSGENRFLTLDLNVAQTGHELKIYGADALKLGFHPGDSTLISNYTKLGELGASGKNFKFSINGTDFEFNENDTVGSMISKINSSNAGVRISYSTLSDTFKIEATSTGAHYGIDITQTEGNLLNIILGDTKINSGSSVASSQLTTDTVEGTSGGLASGYTTTGASLAMNVNGTNYTFTLSGSDTYNKAAIETAFDAWLNDTFGESEGVQNIKFDNGNLTVQDGFAVKFAQTTVDTSDSAAVAAAAASDLALAFGFSTTASSNIADSDTPISDIIQLQGLTILDSSGNPAGNLSEIAEINGFDITYSGSRLVFTGSGNIDLSSEPELSELFGATSFTLSDGSLKADAVNAGTDALVSVNGIDIYRSTNTFTIDGITMELTETSDEILDNNGLVVGYEETLISTSRDADKIVEAMKGFVEAYNSMLEKLNGYIDEDANYRKYAPLTPKQEDEMTEKEIELWEEKAKQGLVRNDTYISGFLSQMRTILYTKPDSSDTALYNIGIETKSWEYKGQLEFDETAFRNALATNPDDIKELFTNKTEGLSAQITKIVDDTAKLSVASPGTLVSLAGAKNYKSNSKNNTLYWELQSIEDKLKDLNKRYEKERARYWSQFNQMERTISNFSSQSSMISQTFSGY